MITGVPRAGRDEEYSARLALQKDAIPERPILSGIPKPVEPPPTPRPMPTPEPPRDVKRYKVRVTVKPPDNKGFVGQIIEGSFSVINGTTLLVYNDAGDQIGSAQVNEAEDNVVYAAQKVLREKSGHHLAFYDELPRLTSGSLV